MVEKLVSYLEMTHPAQLRPADGIVGLALVHLDRASSEAARIRWLHDAIATPHLWSSLGRSDDGWQRSLTDPARSHWIATVDGTDVGWASLVPDGDGGVEIGSFGIRADVVGRGYGGAFLTELVRQAWRQLAPGAGARPPASARVWLHTSSWDHPHALANYRARGFTPSRLELQDQRPGEDDRRTRPVARPPRYLVRPAVPGDRDAVAALIGHLGYALPVERAGERLARLSRSPDDLVAVATERGHDVVGFVSAHLVPMVAEAAAGFARITSLTVSPEVVRSGVGRRLLDLVEYWARDRGAALLEVSSGRRPERRAAHGFYRALGFEDTADASALYRRRLDDG